MCNDFVSWEWKNIAMDQWQTVKITSYSLWCTCALEMEIGDS